MNIFLLRHGEYNQETTDQPLSHKGRKQIKAIGEHLFQAGFFIEKILSSPKTRAKESAEIIAAELGLGTDEITETPFLKPSSAATDILSLAQDNPDIKSLLLTGHLPSIAQAASLLLTGNEKPLVRFETATLCNIFIYSFSPLRSELLSVINPGAWLRPENIKL